MSHNEKVNRENRQLLERLQDIKSNYNVQKWSKQRKETEKLVANKCRYSYIFGSKPDAADYLTLPVISLDKKPVLVVNSQDNFEDEPISLKTSR